jgi:hypothetical protein
MADDDDQVTAGQTGQTAGPAPQQHVGGKPQPSRPPPGGEDGYVKNAVIRLRFGQKASGGRGLTRLSIHPSRPMRNRPSRAISGLRPHQSPFAIVRTVAYYG